MNTYWKAAIMAAFAVVLAVCLTHIETRVLPENFDICETDGWLERPIITFDYIQSQCMCKKSGKRGIAFTQLTGIYERAGVPRLAAISAGVAIPLALLLMAAVTAGRALRGSARIIVAVTSLAVGGLSFLAGSLEIYSVFKDSYHYRWMVQFWLFDPYTPRDILVWLMGALAFAGGVWLFGKASRDRRLTEVDGRLSSG